MKKIMKKIANFLHAWLNNSASVCYMTPTGMIPMV